MFEISCKELAETYKDIVKAKLSLLPHPLHLHIIANGTYAGGRYIANKIKVATECNIITHLHTVNIPEGEDEKKYLLSNVIDGISQNEAIIIQQPFSPVVDNALDELLDSLQDADGLTTKAKVKPATALGIYKLLKLNNLIESKHIVIIGRSKLVGKPLAQMFTATDATVTLCHSKTKDLSSITKQADVIVVAVGKEKFLTKEYVSQEKEVHIVDVGINVNSQGKICGDVDPEISSATTFVTPVPGGVGLLTTACLMNNVYKLKDTDNVQTK